MKKYAVFDYYCGEVNMKTYFLWCSFKVRARSEIGHSQSFFLFPGNGDNLSLLLLSSCHINGQLYRILKLSRMKGSARCTIPNSFYLLLCLFAFRSLPCLRAPSAAAAEPELTCLTVWNRFQSAFISWRSLSDRIFASFPLRPPPPPLSPPLPTALPLIFNSLIRRVHTGFTWKKKKRNSTPLTTPRLRLPIYLTNTSLSAKQSRRVSGDDVSEWKLRWNHLAAKHVAHRATAAWVCELIAQE